MMSNTRITNTLTINAPGKDVVFDGLDFTENGYIKVTAAKSVVVRNCRIYGLNVESAKKNYWFMVSAQSPVRVEIENCFFGDNVGTNGALYNMIEPHVELNNGTSVSNNYFNAKSCTHNAINVYGAVENAVIDLSGNVFELSSGTIRLGPKGSVTCEINMNDNVIKSCDMTIPRDYDGLALLQPYNKETESFEKMTVRMDNNICPSEQLIYGYSGSGDTMLTQEKMPTIVINGVEIEAPIYH